MTRIDLQAIFDKNEIPTNFYSFRGAGGGDVWALEPVETGFVLDYYNDRGTREQEAVFDNENDGCLALLAKVSDVLRGEQHRDIEVD